MVFPYFLLMSSKTGGFEDWRFRSFKVYSNCTGFMCRVVGRDCCCWPYTSSAYSGLRFEGFRVYLGLGLRA